MPRAMRALALTLVLIPACSAPSSAVEQHPATQEDAGQLPETSLEIDSAMATDTAPPPPKGIDGLYQLRAVHSMKCLAITRDSTDDGALLVQRACNTATGQAFRIDTVGPDLVRLTNVFTGRVVDVKDKATTDGARLQQWRWSDGDNQRFTLEKQSDGTYAILSKSSGRALDVVDASTADEANVQQWSFHGGDNQKFELVPYTMPKEGFVHADGAILRDGSGNHLLPRGVNLGNWLVPEGYMWKLDGGRGDRARRIEARIEEVIGKTDAESFWKAYRANYITEADVARIAELGFDSIRSPINARLLLPEGSDTFDESGFAYVADTVAWAKKHGVRVILDMHCAPGGQTGKNIDDSPNDYPELYESPTNRARLIKLWTELARRFVNEPAVFGYDLLNEPLPGDFSKLNSYLWKVYVELKDAIRKVDANHLLIVEGANWANDWSALAAPFDPNMAYSFHKYWNANDVGAIQHYLDKRAEWNRPVWVGESGENDDAWYRASFSLLEQHDVGWCFWPWKKLDSGNNPYSIDVPAGWDAFQAWVRDSKKPAATTAKSALMTFADNAKLAKARENVSAVCALLPCP